MGCDHGSGTGPLGFGGGAAPPAAAGFGGGGVPGFAGGGVAPAAAGAFGAAGGFGAAGVGGGVVAGGCSPEAATGGVTGAAGVAGVGGGVVAEVDGGVAGLAAGVDGATGAAGGSGLDSAGLSVFDFSFSSATSICFLSYKFGRKERSRAPYKNKEFKHSTPALSTAVLAGFALCASARQICWQASSRRTEVHSATTLKLGWKIEGAVESGLEIFIASDLPRRLPLARRCFQSFD